MVLARNALAGALLAATLVAPAAAQEVNVYTTREPRLAKPLFEGFTKATGIKVNSIFVKEGLAERVKAEGAGSPADVLMTVDIGNLLDTVDQGVTQPIRSEVLDAAIPANLRGADGSWYTLSMRARIAYVSKERVTDKALTYESLADPKWKGKVCFTSGHHPYNTALVAAHIVHHGEARTEAWLQGLKANLARKPGGGDRNGARDIMGGICDLAIGNSYYVGLMRSGNGGPEQKQWGEAINTILPAFEGGGTMVNISGASVARHAPNKANAVKLLEYLLSDDAQHLYASGNFEYPVRAGAPTDPIIVGLGTLKVDGINLLEIAKARKAASALVDKVGFNN